MQINPLLFSSRAYLLHSNARGGWKEVLKLVDEAGVIDWYWLGACDLDSLGM
jgi:hypothetical protein